MEPNWRTLADWFAALGPGARVAVAWSGGVDSSLAALAARQVLGERALALTADTPLVPAWERHGLENAARNMGLEWQRVSVDLLAVPGVAANGPDRCYHCKRALLSTFLDGLRATGRDWLLVDGTNADDDPARPGRRALREFKARSPLAETGLGKADVRALARLRGLAAADRPSESCLATRLAGPLTQERLGLVERVESLVRLAGARDCRVRLGDHGDDQRDDELTMSIETTRHDRPSVQRAHDRIMDALMAGGVAGYGWAERPGEGAWISGS